MIVADLQGIYNELYNDVGRYQVNVGVQLGTLLQIQAQFGLDLLHLQLLLLRNHFLLRNLCSLHLPNLTFWGVVSINWETGIDWTGTIKCSDGT